MEIGDQTDGVLPSLGFSGALLITPLQVELPFTIARLVNTNPTMMCDRWIITYCTTSYNVFMELTVTNILITSQCPAMPHWMVDGAGQCCRFLQYHRLWNAVQRPTCVPAEVTNAMTHLVLWGLPDSIYFVGGWHDICWLICLNVWICDILIYLS